MGQRDGKFTRNFAFGSLFLLFNIQILYPPLILPYGPAQIIALLNFILVGRAGVGGQGTGKGHDGRAKVPQPHFQRGMCPGRIRLCVGGDFFRCSINQKLPFLSV